MKSLPFFAVAFLLCADPVRAQELITGSTGHRMTDGKPAYRADNPDWSFEAVTDYYRGDTVSQTARVIRHPLGTRIEEWRGDLRRGTPPDRNRKPDILYLYKRQSGVVWSPSPRQGDNAFRLARAYCLAVLLRKVKKSGEATVRRRYNIPAAVTFDEAGCWRILGEQGIGSNIPDRTALAEKRYGRKIVLRGHGPSFLVNGLPSGFGWPALMFRLRLFTPETVMVEGVTYEKQGDEAVAGVRCVRYGRTEDLSKQTLWVEPKTRLILRYEQMSIRRGSRRPPVRSGYRTTSFRFLKVAPPPSAFELPKGSTAALPRLLYNISLPPGVRRKPLEGLDAEVGFPFVPYPAGGSRAVSKPPAARN